MPSLPRPSRARRAARSERPRTAAPPRTLPSPPSSISLRPGTIADAARNLAQSLTARRVERDYVGWTGSEVLADLDHGDPTTAPVRRAGHEVVARINALSGSLPAEAVVLGRAITDTAPPLGERISPALRDLLGRYVPESLDAYSSSTRRGPHTPAQELLLTQFRLLYDVAHHIERAENEHDEQALVIQARFLRERFAEISRSNDLDVDPARPKPRRPLEPRPVPAQPAFDGGRSFLQPHHDPVTLLPLEDGHGPTLSLRLALPKGYAVRLGSVAERPNGATTFEQKQARRVLAPSRNTGFARRQSDVRLRVDLASERRVLLYAYGLSARSLKTTTFVATKSGAQVEIATILLGRRAHPLTVIATGLVTPDGLVLRSEGTVWPDLRSACEAYDVRRISWLDAQTPFV